MSGRWFLVTGSSRGIGRATVLRLAAADAVDEDTRLAEGRGGYRYRVRAALVACIPPWRMPPAGLPMERDECDSFLGRSGGEGAGDAASIWSLQSDDEEMSDKHAARTLRQAVRGLPCRF